MSILTDKKEERSRLAIEAAVSGRFNDAFIHAVEAARIGLDLAGQTEGAMARAYVDDANGWLDLAKKLKDRLGEPSAAGGAADVGAKVKEGESCASSRWLVAERPKERFSDVAGLEEVKRIVYDDVINAAKFQSAYSVMGVPADGGALMYGPPGNGKTLIARAIAGELDASFFAISGALIKSKYVGEMERNMRRLFEEAGRCKRAVVFIDEVQAPLSRRDSEKASAVDGFIAVTDGFERGLRRRFRQRENTLLFLGATNYPWMIDGAALMHFKNKIYVGMPDAAARRQILERHFQGVPICEPLDFDRYAARTEGLSGADIARVATTAKKTALRRMIDENAHEPLLLPGDVESAIYNTKPTVSAATIQKYRDWETEFYGGTGDFASRDGNDEED